MLPSADDVLEIAKKVARRYARRCWWASREDLEQEASLAVMQAARTFDPHVGVPFKGYAHRAAVNALGPYLWRQSSPVSETFHRLKTLAGVVHTELKEAYHLASPDRPDLMLEEAQWRQQVRERVLALAQETPDGQLAMALLLEGEAAAEDDQPRQSVYRASARIRGKIRIDWELYSLWKERNG